MESNMQKYQIVTETKKPEQESVVVTEKATVLVGQVITQVPQPMAVYTG